MNWSVYAYMGVVLVLSGALLGIIVYYYKKDREDKVESPKFSMLDDDDVLDTGGKAAIRKRYAGKGII
ncbi:MAG: cbb3-type cytochrome c oxidase subunit 3 [Nitrospirae bacterium]|nr:cbb3-type cytochrome c oxidase subunit 3 [Nitrospirota bacterium]